MNTKKLWANAVLLLSVLLLSGCAVSEKASGIWEKVSHIGIEVSKAPKQHVVIVPGYGAPVVGNRSYQEYIQQVADFVGDASRGVGTVVFTGGYSQLQNTSEAESMKDYFMTVVDSALLKQLNITLYTEECSIVSWQNVTYTKDLLTKAGIVPDSVTIFGDHNRAEKLQGFSTVAFNTDIAVPDSARELLAKGVNYTTVQFMGYDFGDSAYSEAERNAAFAVEIAGATDAQLGNVILQKRIDDWTKRFGYNVADNLVAKGCSQYAGFTGQ